MEVGAGIGSFILPHYLGADQQSQYTIPIPYIIYRGDLINADSDGFQGFIYNSERLDLRLSFSGALPVNSEDNDTRAGMDDLDLMAEVGPSLEYQLFNDNNHLLRLDFPIRAAFTLGSPFMHYQGWTTNPGFYHQYDRGKLSIQSNVGVVISNKKYHSYIYDVQEHEVTDDRAFYQSIGGFTAGRIAISAKYQLNNLVFGGTVRYFNLNHAQNNASPLMKKNTYTSFGLYISWIFFQSEAQQRIIQLPHD